MQSPLFAPDRRFAAGAGSAGSAGEGAPGGPTVVAVASGAGFSKALVRGADGKVVSLGRGGSIDGWRIVTIRQDEVLVARVGAQRVLTVGAPADPSPQPDAQGDGE